MGLPASHSGHCSAAEWQPSRNRETLHSRAKLPGRLISRITRCTIYAYVYSNSKNNQKQNRGTMKYMMRRLPDDAEPGINWYLHNRCKCRVSIELLAIKKIKREQKE